MDSDFIAVGLLAILVVLGACIGIGVISSSVWNAIGMAMALVLLLAFICFLVLDPIDDHGGDTLAKAFGVAMIVETLKYMLPAAAFVAAAASIVSNGGRLRRAPKTRNELDRLARDARPCRPRPKRSRAIMTRC